MAFGDFDDLPRITASDEVLRDKAFNIAKNPEYDRYQLELALKGYTFFYKKTTGGVVTLALPKTLSTGDKSATKCKIMSNQQLPE